MEGKSKACNNSKNASAHDDSVDGPISSISSLPISGSPASLENLETHSEASLPQRGSYLPLGELGIQIRPGAYPVYLGENSALFQAFRRHVPRPNSHSSRNQASNEIIPGLLSVEGYVITDLPPAPNRVNDDTSTASSMAMAVESPPEQQHAADDRNILPDKAVAATASSSLQCWRKSYSYFIVVYIILGMMIIFAIIIPVDMSTHTSDEDTTSLAEDPATLRFRTIQAIVTPLTSHTTAMRHATSASAKALRWIAYDDEARVPVSDIAWIQQRYVAAAVYFAFGSDEGWKDRMKFLSAEHECHWNNVTRSSPHFGMILPEGFFCSTEKPTAQQSIVSLNIQGKYITVQRNC